MNSPAPFLPVFAFALALQPWVSEAGLFSRSKDKSLPKDLKVRTTAYTHTEADHLQYGKKTAAGGTLKYTKKYTSAAADWSKFPLGTKFKIDGINTTFVIDDYGSALVGSETIDIYHPSKSAMNRWGVKHVDITILEYGDFEASRDILEDRTKYAHVRKMLAGINKDPGPKPQKADTPPSPAPASPSPPAPGIPEPPVKSEPEIQLAWSSPPPTPAPAPPAPSPAPQADLTPAAAPASPSISQPAPEPPSSPETAAPVLASTEAPSSTPPPPPPAPRVRKFAPITLAGFSDSRSPAPQPEEIISVAASAGNTTNTTATMASASTQAPVNSPTPPAFRKRDFRPLMASVNP